MRAARCKAFGVMAGFLLWVGGGCLAPVNWTVHILGEDHYHYRYDQDGDAASRNPEVSSPIRIPPKGEETVSDSDSDSTPASDLGSSDLKLEE